MLKKIKSKIKKMIEPELQFEMERIERFDMDEEGNIIGHYVLDIETNEWREE